MPSLEQEFHDQVRPVVTAIIPEGIHMSHKIIKRIAVIKKYVKSRKIFGRVYIDHCRIGDYNCIWQFVNRLRKVLIKRRLWFCNPDSIVVSGAYNQLNVFRNPFQEPCAFCILLFYVLYEQFLFLFWVNTTSIN